MNKRKSTNDFSTILSSFLILLLVVGVVGFLFIFTDNFTTDIKTFYIKCNNTTFIGDYENFNIVKDTEYKFDVVNTFGIDNQLEISVVPNTSIEESSFCFYANNIYHQYCYEESLTSAFEIKAYSKYFTFKATKDLSDILATNYPTQTITGCPIALNSGIPYFRLAIISTNLTQQININFNLIEQIIDGTLTITPQSYCSDGGVSVEFDTRNIVLTNYIRSSSFEFSVPEGYAFSSIEYDSTLFNATISGNICTISLVSNLDNYYSCDLVFNIYYVGSTECYLIIMPEEYEYGKHITFSPGHLILDNQSREMSFNFIIEEGYSYNLEYENQDVFDVTITENTCTIKIKDGVILTQSYQFVLTFYVYSN